MAFSAYVLYLIFLCATSVESAFRYETCNTTDSILHMPTLELLPDPVDLGQNLTVSVHGEILRDIPETAQLEVKYYGLRTVFGVQFDILIPCLLGKYGSCTLPICEYVDRFQKQICPFFTNSTSCECPLKARSYGGDGVEIPMAKPSVITRLLVKGQYRTEMRIKYPETGEELACFKFYTELT